MRHCRLTKMLAKLAAMYGESSQKFATNASLVNETYMHQDDEPAGDFTSFPGIEIACFV